MASAARVLREMRAMARDPADGVACWPDEEDAALLHATIEGPPATPYAGGVFRLEVRITARYPFEPPTARFLTPIFHPNIDKSSGTICASVLKMPPKGDWQPSLGIMPLLVSLRGLLSSPNAADGLDADATSLFRRDRAAFTQKAAHWTRTKAGAPKRPREAASPPAADDLGAAAGPAGAGTGSGADFRAKRPRASPPRQADDTTLGRPGTGVPDDAGAVLWRRRARVSWDS